VVAVVAVVVVVVTVVVVTVVVLLVVFLSVIIVAGTTAATINDNARTTNIKTPQGEHNLLQPFLFVLSFPIV